MGYYVYAKVEGDLIFPPIKSATPKEKDLPYVLDEANKTIEGLSWQMQIKAGGGKVADSDNFIGAGQKAKDGYDTFDVMEPPQMTPFVSVYFQHGDWGQEAGKYANDVRGEIPPDPPLTKGGTASTSLIPHLGGGVLEWDMQVVTDLQKENITLSFEEIIPLGEGLDIQVADLANGQTFNPITQKTYTYNSYGGGIRRFKITVGKNVNAPKPVTPVTVGKVYNFPNPSRNPHTTFKYDVSGTVTKVEIELYTLSGKLIVKLLGEMDGDTTWTIPPQIANGVYLYRVVVYDAVGGKQTRSGKMVLLR